MNFGLVIGRKNIAILAENGMAQMVENNHKSRAELFSLSISSPWIDKCFVVFEESMKKGECLKIFNELQYRYGYISFYPVSFEIIILLGSYSIPKHNQPCISISSTEINIFTVNPNNYLCKENEVKLHFQKMFQNQETVDTMNYVTDLYTDRVVFETKSVLSKVFYFEGKNFQKNGIMVFGQDLASVLIFVNKLEKNIKQPVIFVNNSFDSLKEHLSHILKEKMGVLYLINNICNKNGKTRPTN